MAKPLSESQCHPIASIRISLLSCYGPKQWPSRSIILIYVVHTVAHIWWTCWQGDIHAGLASWTDAFGLSYQTGIGVHNWLAIVTVKLEYSAQNWSRLTVDWTRMTQTTFSARVGRYNSSNPLQNILKSCLIWSEIANRYIRQNLSDHKTISADYALLRYSWYSQDFMLDHLQNCARVAAPVIFIPSGNYGVWVCDGSGRRAILSNREYRTIKLATWSHDDEKT